MVGKADHEHSVMMVSVRVVRFWCTLQWWKVYTIIYNTT